MSWLPSAPLPPPWSRAVKSGRRSFESQERGESKCRATWAFSDFFYAIPLPAYHFWTSTGGDTIAAEPGRQTIGQLREQAPEPQERQRRCARPADFFTRRPALPVPESRGNTFERKRRPQNPSPDHSRVAIEAGVKFMPSEEAVCK